MKTHGGRQDLADFLERLGREKPEKLLTINDEVPVDFSSTALAMELSRRGDDAVVLLNRLKDSPFRMVANLFASHELISYGVGSRVDEFGAFLGECLDNPIPSTEVEEGPVQQIVLEGDQADVTRLPVPYHFEGDAGPYITAALVSAHDPDTGVGNLAYARIQVKGPRKLGISLHSRQHLWDYHRRAEEAGRDLPAAIIIGGHPAVMIAGAAKMAVDQDEHDFAGALLGESLRVVWGRTADVRVPAEAEIVIEGKILAG